MNMDAYVAEVEHYGRCHDCVAGEPHACPDLHREHLARLLLNRVREAARGVL